eukprot:2770574-Heterocapsa_arctica.AAC.1
MIQDPNVFSTRNLCETSVSCTASDEETLDFKDALCAPAAAAARTAKLGFKRSGRQAAGSSPVAHHYDDDANDA